MAKKGMQQRRNGAQGRRRLPWLKVAGVVLLFGSWIADNHLTKKWEAAEEVFSGMQLHIALHELALADSLAEANATRRQSDQSWYRFHLADAIRHLYEIGWGYRQLEEPERVVEHHYQLLQKRAAVSRAVADEDTSWLRATLEELQRRRESEAGEKQLVAERLLRILEGQDRARFWFSCLYVAGSLLVGVDFLKGYKERARSR